MEASQHQYQVKNEAISEEINFMGRQALEDKAQVWNKIITQVDKVGTRSPNSGIKHA